MSFYLDDMAPPAGVSVVCKANLASPNFTVGNTYVVQTGNQLIDDTGTKVYPSARFERRQAQ